MKKDKISFLKISDLPTGEYAIIINNRSNGVAHTQAMIMLKWLKSILEVYDDKRYTQGNLRLRIKEKISNQQEILKVINVWLEYDI